MLRTGQNQRLNQKQKQQQRLSPQQIQYIKLLQLPTIAFEQRIKEEIELNPVLEEDFPEDGVAAQETVEEDSDNPADEEIDPVDQTEEMDWDEFETNTDYDRYDYGPSSGGGNQEWRDLPNPYYENLLEELEQQVALLDLNDEQKLIATQVLGSLDEDGYFRRETEAVVDNIAFNEGVLTSEKKVEGVRKQIQRLDPPGIASKDLQDCLKIQLELLPLETRGCKIALDIVTDHWPSFKKKHFSKIKQKLNIDDVQLKDAFDCIRRLDPKPGGHGNEVDDNKNYIEPDFEVIYEEGDVSDEEGDFVITMNNQNIPSLKISPRYKEMWDDLKKKKSGDNASTKTFLKDKLDSANWFINSIRQRQTTMMNTMKTIVALQEEFFKHGEGLNPMIMKDIAERVNLDVSTISRVVNGKYVQTKFGTFELKYFFSEGIQTESGKEVSSREVKKVVRQIIDGEDKQSPLSDKSITQKLKKQGYKVARRTVSKYRETLNIPVARLRKQIF
jgi:RNA polymerase sigma-54 factor